MIKEFASYLKDAVRRPRVELTRRQRQVRYAWELVAHCWRVLRRHRAEGMAAELTYRTIFSLIPLVVLGLITFRVFGGLSDIQSTAEDQLFSFFGVPEIPEVAYQDEVSSRDQRSDQNLSTSDFDQVVSGNGGSTSKNVDDSGKVVANEGEIDTAADRRQVQASIRWALRELTEKVGTVNFASIGVVGLLLFIYAAIALSNSVENIFNLIYEAPSERSFLIRIAIHWSVITLGSGLLSISLYTSSRLVDYVGTATSLSVSGYLHHVLALVSSWVLLFLLYSLMPNAKVSLLAAAVGSLVAAILWECAKFGFQVYVSKAVPYSALYGSLGLIPLFLFWIYVTWFLFLFGLVWTYTMQTAPGRVPSKEEDEHWDDLLLADPDWLILLMLEIAKAFEEGETVRGDELGTRIGLPARVIPSMLEALENKGLVRRMEGEQVSRYILARPAERIMVCDVVAAGRHESDRHPAWRMLKVFRDRQDDHLAQISLAGLLRQVRQEDQEDMQVLTST